MQQHSGLLKHCDFSFDKIHWLYLDLKDLLIISTNISLQMRLQNQIIVIIHDD